MNLMIFSSGMWDLISLKSMAAPMDPSSVQLPEDPEVCVRCPVSSCYCSEPISGFCWSQDKDTILPRAHRVVLKYPPPPSPQTHTELPFASGFCILPSTTGPLHMQLSLLVVVHWGHLELKRGTGNMGERGQSEAQCPEDNHTAPKCNLKQW